MAGRRLSDEEKSSAIDPLLLLDETDALGSGCAASLAAQVQRAARPWPICPSPWGKQGRTLP
jgi:hypothetical protein